MKAALYIRVSTASKSKQVDTVKFIQNPEVQEQPLRDLIAQRGWTIYRVYSDRASGASRAGVQRFSDRDQYPALLK